MSESILEEILVELLGEKSSELEGVSLAPVSLLSEKVRGAPSVVRGDSAFSASKRSSQAKLSLRRLGDGAVEAGFRS